MVVSLLTHICVTRPQWVNVHLSLVTYVKLYLKTITNKTNLRFHLCLSKPINWYKPKRDNESRWKNSKYPHANPNQYPINRHCRSEYPVTWFSLPLHANVALLCSPYQAQRLTAVSLPYKWGTDKIYWLTMINFTVKIKTCWPLISINHSFITILFYMSSKRRLKLISKIIGTYFYLFEYIIS